MKPTDGKLSRCQRRAKIARKTARVLRVVLIGLMGAALISDPALQSSVQAGMSEVVAYGQEVLMDPAAEVRRLAEAPAVSDLQLADTSVARADTSFLRP